MTLVLLPSCQDPGGMPDREGFGHGTERARQLSLSGLIVVSPYSDGSIGYTSAWAGDRYSDGHSLDAVSMSEVAISLMK